MSFFEFPHTRTYDNDLGWVIRRIVKMSDELTNFINFNTIKYADPIAWNITTQYEANTVVINPADGTAYISTRPVPSGVLVTNTDYWTPIFNYGESLDTLREQIAAANEMSSGTAHQAYNEGDLVWLNGVLHVLLADIPAGTAFIEGTNVEEITVEQFFGENIDALHSEFESAIAALKWYLSPEMFGAVGDGVTDDSAAFIQMAQAARDTKKSIIIPNKTYKLGTSVNFRECFDIRCDGTLDGNILIGGIATEGEPFNMNFQKVTGKVRSLGMKNAYLVIQYADKFLYEADGSESDNASSSYNRISLGTVHDLEIYAHGSGAWITETDFDCSRITDLNIWTDSAALTINTMRIYSACLEGGSVSMSGKVRLCRVECRAEGTFNISFDGDPSCRDNTIVRQYRVNEIWPVEDYGNNNIVFYDYMEHMNTTPVYQMDRHYLGNIANNRISPTASGFACAAWAPIYDTGKLPLTEGLTRIRFQASAAGLNFQLTLYDQDGVLIGANNNEVGGLGISFNASISAYSLSSPAYSDYILTIKPRVAKFFEFKLANGNTAKEYEYVRIEADAVTCTNVGFPVPDYTNINTEPTGEGWENGDFVKSTQSNNQLGWVKYGNWIPVYFNPLRIKTVTATPNTAGNVSIDLSTGVVVGVTASGNSNTVCHPFRNGTSWWVRCTSSANGNPITTEVTLQVYYLDLAATY